MKLPLSRIAQLLSANVEFDGNAVALGYSIDSRSIRPGELFFAVKGARMDGHDFVDQALQNGAVAAVVQKDRIAAYSSTARLIAVKDTLSALQALAGAVRQLWGKPLIGI